MKDTERAFLNDVQLRFTGVTVRDVCQRYIDASVPSKRLYYWLGKWANKGWYEWGSVIDLGWLTPKDRTV